MFHCSHIKRPRYFISLLWVLCSCVFSTVCINAQSNPLFTAVKNNDTISLQALLNKKINPDVYDSDGDHLLLYAAMYASANCMKLLLANGANPNAVNKIGETALMWSSHDLEKISLLLQHKANVNAVAKSGNTPLLVACVGQEQQAIIRFLLDHGADPLAVNNNGETVLHRAGLFGDTAVARLILASGADINAQNHNKETALRNAIANENREVALWLLHNGANVNINDSYDAPPLFYAVVLNDLDIVNALLEKTTDVNCVDIDGVTALMWACYDEHENPAILRALLAKGARTDIKDKKGRTAMAWALQKGNTAKAAVLRNAGAAQ